MGDTQYFPPMTDPVLSHGWRPCLICGAMINRPYENQHITWHEVQKSTERLILDNQSPMDQPGGGVTHGTA